MTLTKNNPWKTLIFITNLLKCCFFFKKGGGGKDLKFYRFLVLNLPHTPPRFHFKKRCSDYLFMLSPQRRVVERVSRVNRTAGLCKQREKANTQRTRDGYEWTALSAQDFSKVLCGQWAFLDLVSYQSDLLKNKSWGDGSVGDNMFVLRAWTPESNPQRPCQSKCPVLGRWMVTLKMAPEADL